MYKLKKKLYHRIYVLENEVTHPFKGTSFAQHSFTKIRFSDNNHNGETRKGRQGGIIRYHVKNIFVTKKKPIEINHPLMIIKKIITDYPP